MDGPQAEDIGNAKTIVPGESPSEKIVRIWSEAASDIRKLISTLKRLNDAIDCALKAVDSATKEKL